MGLGLFGTSGRPGSLSLNPAGERGFRFGIAAHREFQLPHRMNQKTLPLVLIVTALFGTLHAASPSTPGSGSGSASCGAEMLPKPAIKKAMADFIAAKEIAGAVTLVADGANILHLSADGLADIDY